MKHNTIITLLLALLAAGCGSQEKPSLPYTGQLPVDGDSTVYGLVCDGSNDTIMVFLREPYDGSDPDTFNILAATTAHRVFGVPRIGDRVAMVRDTADTASASIVIVTQDMLGQWCYRVKPVLSRLTAIDGQTLTPDSLERLLETEREYGISIKADSVAMSIGQRASANADETSPVTYPRMKRYRQWFIRNGQLILVESIPDSLGNTSTTSSDTADFVRLTADSLVLRFDDGEHSFYRKAENNN